MDGLRDYQQGLLEQAEAALQPSKARVMLQLPTGGGKTRIASSLLAGWIRKGGKAVWLTHRQELSDQTCRVLNDSGVPATNNLEWDNDEPAPAMNGEVIVLMAQTVSGRNRDDSVWDKYAPEDLLVVDEAHHSPAAGWERTINEWPGRVVGLTATPWRLGKSQEFRHLFDCLILGPQINDMQARGWLANVQALMPAPEEIILGGQVARGDYSESGIELANQDRPNVMTAGALEFWQGHAQDRQTIIYAVSTEHADNLAAVFNNADVPADVILGRTPAEERTRRVRKFSDGELKVLINVVVAIEGFDLPDASCIVMTRPTMSLSLYLQMVGRGLRPKSDGRNCLLLDLAGNVERHGLPDEKRRWSLESRGQQIEGDAPVVRCPNCDGVSPAASRSCQLCQNPFGRSCERCGTWRAWKRWSAERYCGDTHDLVCNLCHPDAHRLANLPEGLEKLLRRELTESQAEVNPSSLHTLEELQVRLFKVAEKLVFTRKIGDMAEFNRMTEQLKPLLRRETRLKKARDAEIGENFIAEHGPGIEAATKKTQDAALELGTDMKITQIFVEFDPEKGMRTTLYYEKGDEPCVTEGEWEPMGSGETETHN